MKKPKFKFGLRFRYEDFPKIKKCHDEYEKLGDRTYEIESLKDEGKCTENDWCDSLDLWDNYSNNVYAKVIFEEFKGKGIYLKRPVGKEIKAFDEVFYQDNFNEITLSQRSALTSIFEGPNGWKLPVEYYETKKETKSKEK